MRVWTTSEFSLLYFYVYKSCKCIYNVTDLLKALLDNGPVNKFQHTRCATIR
jgi:hypothetical protein